MLTELTINDLAIIDELHLQLASGFNVLTGETGAGKSIIIDAVEPAVGRTRRGGNCPRRRRARASRRNIRSQPGRWRVALDPLLTENGLEGDEPDTLALAREVRKGGRGVCRVNGRAVTLALLRDIGQYLVDIHGQSRAPVACCACASTLTC